jgi:hypothetical protein
LSRSEPDAPDELPGLHEESFRDEIWYDVWDEPDADDEYPAWYPWPGGPPVAPPSALHEIFTRHGKL